MAVAWIFSLLMAIEMVTGMVVPRDEMLNIVRDEQVHFDVNVAGQITEENIEMNYEENYVRVSTLGFGHIQPMVLIHDYTKDLTLVKISGQCFMLNEYADAPEKMEDWYTLNLNMEGGVVQAGDRDQYRVHNYKIVPFALNRTSLPAVMQRECDEIDMMVLEGTTEGEPAYREVQDGVNDNLSFMGAVFLPTICDQLQEQEPGLKGTPRRTRRGIAAGGGPCKRCNFCVVNPRPSQPAEQ